MVLHFAADTKEARKSFVARCANDECDANKIHLGSVYRDDTPPNCWRCKEAVSDVKLEETPWKKSKKE